MAFTGGSGSGDWLTLARDGSGIEEYIYFFTTYISEVTEGTMEIPVKGFKITAAR